MKITGHRTEAVYRRCAIVSDADLRGATRRLTGTIPGQTRGLTASAQPGTLQTQEVSVRYFLWFPGI